MRILTLLSLHLCAITSAQDTDKVNIRFKADDNFRKIGYGQYEEGKLTTRTIAEGTFEDPNGKDVEIHFLRYSTDKKRTNT